MRFSSRFPLNTWTPNEVSTLVNSPANDSPECMSPVAATAQLLDARHQAQLVDEGDTVGGLRGRGARAREKFTRATL
jgi:hypothetical protein